MKGEVGTLQREHMGQERKGVDSQGLNKGKSAPVLSAPLEGLLPKDPTTQHLEGRLFSRLPKPNRLPREGCMCQEGQESEVRAGD